MKTRKRTETRKVSRRGIELNLTMLVLLIIILISSFLIFAFIFRVEELVCNGNVEACRLSVKATFLAEKLGLDIPSQCSGKTYTFVREKPEEVNKVIAQEIEKCVFKYHEGDFDFSERGGRWITDLNVCYRCAEFDFSKYTKIDAYKKEGSGSFGKFLRGKNTICASPKENLFDYLSRINDETNKGDRFLTVFSPFNIDPNSNYILFTKIYKESTFTNFEEVRSDFAWLGYSAESYAVPTLVILAPVGSSGTEKCEQFFQ